MKARKEGRHGTRPVSGYVAGAEPVEPDHSKDWAAKRIAALDSRLGKDKGAKRERERLQIILDAKAPESKKKAEKANG